MKRKFIVALGLASLIGSNVFAMEMGGHLISHKEYTTGSGKVIVKESSIKNDEISLVKSLLEKQNNSNFNHHVSANVSAKDVPPVTIGQAASLSGIYRNFIFNHSMEDKTYTIRHNICLVKKKDNWFQDETCASSIDQVWVEPQHFFVGFKEMDLNATLTDSTVEYFESVETMIYSESGNTIYSTNGVKAIDLNQAGK